jgi:hypothetical protein
MKANQKIRAMQSRMAQRGITLPLEVVQTLRRCEMVLQRWCELECGDGNSYIERDEKTGRPRQYNCRLSYADPKDPRYWSMIPDREKGALKRVAMICDEHNLQWFYQTDPRGCALYIATIEGGAMDCTNYSSRGFAVCD